MSDTIFSQIIQRTLPANIIYEDDICIAIKDINPQASFHILVIPKKFIEKIADAQEDDQNILGHLLMKGAEIAKQSGHGEAFRMVINNGESAGQSVFHLHVHVLAGRPFNWPPG